MAERKIRCPDCGKAVEVPARPNKSPAETVKTAASPTPEPTKALTPEPAKAPTTAPAQTATTNSDELWYMKDVDGEEYGPVAKSDLDDWVAENRLTAECQLLRDGDPQWQWADDVYPQLTTE